MPLVIIESPNKIRKLSSILGRGFKIMATKGHVIDLPPKKVGVNTRSKKFEPTYGVISGKGGTIKAIVEEAKNHDIIYLALDPDREGEAIAAHIASRLPKRGKTLHRVLFHSITKAAVLKAIEEPGDIDVNLFDAQQARRVTDRLVGYRVSPIMWRKGIAGASAGRVQSVALKYVVDREREIEAFVPEEYWEIDAVMDGGYNARLYGVDNAPKVIRTGKTSRGIRKILMESCKRLRVTKVETKERRRSPAAPFTTATLQQAANNMLGWGVDKTMMTAQKIFEAGCFPANTPILVDYDKSLPIQQIVEDSSITEVLSYDLETKKIEKRAITEKFVHRISSNLVEIGLEQNGETLYLLPTEEHPIYIVGKGWTDASKVEVGDKVITYNQPFTHSRRSHCGYCDEWFDGKTELNRHILNQHPDKHGLKIACECPDCGKTYKGVSGLNAHRFWEHGDESLINNTKSNISVSLRNYWAGLSDKERDSLVQRSMAGRGEYLCEECGAVVWNLAGHKLFAHNLTEGLVNLRNGSIRSFWKGADEEYRAEHGRKVQEGLLASGPINSNPSKPERVLIDMNIPGLKYTGNRAFWKTIKFAGKDNYCKNPDFVYMEEGHHTNKVVEVFGAYYHTEPEAVDLIKAYSEVGADCLLLWDHDIYQNPEAVRARVSSHIHNHYAVVTHKKIRKRAGGKPTTMKVYNIEVEGNHNYFAVLRNTDQIQYHKSTKYGVSENRIPILVHNCITYHRTDSKSVDKEKLAEMREHLEKTQGKDHTSPTENTYKNKKASQEAHEAIRPTGEDPGALTGDQFRLFDIIRNRYYASQMADAVFEQLKVELVSIETQLPINFRLRGSKMLFDGFLKVYGANTADVILPEITEGEELPFSAVELVQKFTQPPGRYSDASLVKKMEADGVGRPATYASTIKTLKTRKFVVKNGRSFQATDLGKMVFDYMQMFFPKLVDPTFTAEMEDNLDAVAAGNATYVSVLEEWYTPFKVDLKGAREGDAKFLFRTEDHCPACGEGFLLRKPEQGGGYWYTCDQYPDCKTTAVTNEDGTLARDDDGKPVVNVPPQPPEVGEDEEIPDCPICDNPMELKDGKWGKWWGCSQYKATKCKGKANWTDPNVEVVPDEVYPGITCDKCDDPMIKTTGRFGEYLKCTAVDCKGTQPVPCGICPTCGDFVVERYSRKKKKGFYACRKWSDNCEFVCNAIGDFKPLPDITVVKL